MPNRPAIPAATAKAILLESGHRCAVCGEGCPLEKAHIIPWGSSKDHSRENLICLCANCHRRADQEKWGESVLKEYKRRPWVVRRYVREDETPTSSGTVIIRIGQEQGEVDEQIRLFVQFAVAAFLRISPYTVRVEPLEEGSIRVTVELRREDAEHLLREYASVQPSLRDYLAPYVLLDVQRGMRERERLRVQGTEGIVECMTMPPKSEAVRYGRPIDLRQTERAIRTIKEFFQTNLAEALNLLRVSAPLFVLADTGVNDNLNGVERPVSFPIKAIGDRRAECVQSLAKWKRMALADYGFAPGEGIYTDMNAIRPDEVLDELHSIYVDQWDWERVITAEERNLSFLCRIVEKIYEVIRRTEQHVAETCLPIEPVLPPKIQFVHSAELERRFPDLSRPQREDRICAEHGAVFIIGIGAPLSDGKPHEGRAPDYDDWTTPTERGPGLNGDILVWNPVLGRSFELSSMGIRVDADALKRQLAITGDESRLELLFHRRLLAGELPESIGGGVGQSRLCMLYLRKMHVGEVQCSIWPAAMREELKRQNITLL